MFSQPWLARVNADTTRRVSSQSEFKSTPVRQPSALGPGSGRAPPCLRLQGHGILREVGLSARLKITVRGAVQGVGFRPFIYRLATGAGLNGWVNNSASRRLHRGRRPPADAGEHSCCASKRKNRRAAPSRASKRPGSTRSATPALRSAKAKPAAPRRRWCSRTSPPAPIAWPRSSTRTTAATATRSPTAPTAARASASSNRCPTTARTPR